MALTVFHVKQMVFTLYLANLSIKSRKYCKNVSCETFLLVQYGNYQPIIIWQVKNIFLKL
ncbi:MAG: hypothetical protein A3J93_05235 [Candidatus Magasanikbacteria bacterium RIFOXYC2_FULL_42_28]|uniref:Uncharacterized protein n=1 Tax=Candidatus Magasanikbacteria bacterium RIFOXYC2_FULL_42_28 TaxID=1798704 RepID=A0A1F6NV40_9BACT|nr:MAG: hypothetical protein A3J93_05235 [Candidatus Magasanikbacteria bacterium RIFOXYC2_FULL_42_28]